MLARLRRGLTNEEIAQELGISLDGVKYHVSEILRRLHVETRHEAAAWQAEPTRSRWAPVFAPILAIKKLHLGAVGYAAAAATTGLAAIGIALLVWGVTRTSGRTDTAPSALARTGISKVDRAIDLLVHQNLDGLMAIAQFSPVACSVQQTVGSPPPCATDQPDGTEVNAFFLASCEGTYATSTDQLRQAFGLALLRQPSAAVFAVARDNSADRTEEAYWIAITQDRPSQATADVSFWRINNSGKLDELQNQCGPIGAAQQVAYRFPAEGKPDFVLGPFINCSPPPGQTANFMVTVDGLSPGGVLPQFWGEAKSTLGEDTGERAIVTVRDDTTWIGDLNRLEDVRQGIALQAVGVRQPDCTIVAQTILTSTPNDLQHYHNSVFRVDLDYPSDWVPDPLDQSTIGDAPISYVDPAGREHGFLKIDAATAPTLDYVTDAIAHHLLRPYGDSPTVEDVVLPAGEAKLIFPDPSSSPQLTDAALIIPYPISSTSSAPAERQFFVLYASIGDIPTIATSVRLGTPGIP